MSSNLASSSISRRFLVITSGNLMNNFDTMVQLLSRPLTSNGTRYRLGSDLSRKAAPKNGTRSRVTKRNRKKQ